MDDPPLATRVLMTADTVGGVWTSALELARALGETGVAVALATMGAPLSDQQWLDAYAVPRLEIFESRFKLEWMPDPWHDVHQAGEWLLELENQVRPDFIHLNSFSYGSLPWRSPTLVVGHSCVLSWWQAVKCEPAPAEWNHYAEQVTGGLRRADVVAAPTAAMLSNLEKYYGRPAVSRLLRNGADPALFTPQIKEDFVFTAGRLWDEAKNVAALDRIAPDLPWPVYAAGAGPGGEKLRKLGWQSRRCMASWMGRAAIYALPARYEPFGLSALEAALAGCALVLGDIPSLREVWGPAAAYVRPDDEGDLHQALETLIGDESLRLELAAQARTRALTFSPQRMAQEYMSAYHLARDVRNSRSGG